MLIDWFTVGAQALNFLVLVWLMKRFLYQPVLDAIDARERQVAAALADADAKKTEARHERDDLQAQNAAFEQKRAALWTTASDAAKAEGRRLLGDAAQAADAATARRQDGLRHEAAALKQAIGVRVQQEVLGIVRQALVDLADAPLEDQVCAVFIGRLRTLDGPSKDRLGAAIGSATGPARLRSAFALSESRQAALRHAVNETFAAEVALEFETAPDLVAGIELTVGGQKIEWSIAGHVASLSASVDELLKQPAPVKGTVDVKTAARPVAESEAQPEAVAA